MTLNPDQIVAALVAHRALGSVAAAELEWLAAHGRLRSLEPGEVITSRTGTVVGFFIVLSGRLSITVDRGAGPRKVLEWRGGDLTGLLPYSRLKAPPGDVVAEEPTTVLVIDRELVSLLPRECPEVTAVCVHVMLDRARTFTSSELQDEKMISLGRLAAGLAHELNNPASAVARNASTLLTTLDEFEAVTLAFCATPLSGEARAAVDQARAAATAARRGARRSTLEVSDQQEALAAWFAKRGLGGTDPEQIDALADAGLTVEHLDLMASRTGQTSLPAVVAHLAAEQSVRRLATDLEIAASRIHSLVAAVKRFTFMDQAMVAAPLRLDDGLADTVTLLGAKARQKSVALALNIDAGLPMVEALGGELNQVWTNLLDNAIDATPEGGRVTVSASQDHDEVIVKVSDTGPGIPAAIRARIFDPFFTTKDVGEGTGLGLDIARRIVRKHRGDIDVATGESGTVFQVRLPIAGKNPTS